MTQKDVLRVMSVFSRIADIMSEPPQVIDQADRELKETLLAALEVRTIDGISHDELISRIRGLNA